MMRPPFLMSVRREFSLKVRVLFALFAVLQVVAPSWHVCEMSGRSCCEPVVSATANTTKVRSVQILRCKECSETTTAFDVEARDIPFGKNCLAKMLWAMPWQCAAPPEIVNLASRRRLSTPSTPRLIANAQLPQVPTRAPPLFS